MIVKLLAILMYITTYQSVLCMNGIYSSSDINDDLDVQLFEQRLRLYTNKNPEKRIKIYSTPKAHEKDKTHPSPKKEYDPESFIKNTLSLSQVQQKELPKNSTELKISHNKKERLKIERLKQKKLRRQNKKKVNNQNPCENSRMLIVQQACEKCKIKDPQQLKKIFINTHNKTKGLDNSLTLSHFNAHVLPRGFEYDPQNKLLFITIKQSRITYSFEKQQLILL